MYLIIALHAVRRQEDTRYGIIVPGVVVVQAGNGVAVLAGVVGSRLIVELARVRTQLRACRVARGAVGSVQLRAEQGGVARHVVEDGQQAVQVVCQVEIGRGDAAAGGLQFADEAAIQAVVVRANLV